MRQSASGGGAEGPWYRALGGREFRRYWIGYVLSVSGQQMLWVAEGWLVYEMTGSKLLLGAIGLSQVVPSTLLTLFGGVAADKFDQRRLLIALQLAQMALLAILSALAFSGAIQVWHILGAAFLRSAAGSFENPARQAMFPNLVGRQDLGSAVALNATIHPGTRILGPAVAGGLLGWVFALTESAPIAAGSVFAVTALGFVVYAWFLFIVAMPPVKRSVGMRVLHDMAAGVGLVWSDGIFRLITGTAYFMMLTAWPMNVLFPVFAKDILGVGAPGLGFMYTAQGIGSFLGAVAAGHLGRDGRARALIVSGAVCLGTFAVLFALSESYVLSLLLLAGAGAGSSVASVAMQSTMQLLVADDFRGRVMGIWGMTHSTARPLGEMQLAAVAALVSAPFAIGLGGAVVAVFALLVVLPNRRLRSLGATAEREAVEAG